MAQFIRGTLLQLNKQEGDKAVELDKALRKSSYNCAQIDSDGTVVTVDGRLGFYKVTVDGELMDEIDSLDELNDIIEEYGLPPDGWYWMGQK